MALNRNYIKSGFFAVILKRNSFLQRGMLLFFVFNAISFFCFAQFSPSEIADIKKLVLKWSQLQSPETLPGLESLYDSQLFYFYGNPISKAEAIKNKKAYFDRHKNYRQEIVSSIQLSFYPSAIVKCSFDKKVFTEKKARIYSSYLLFKKGKNALVIAGESDLITDANLNKKPDIGEEIKNISPSSGNFIYVAIVILFCCVAGYYFISRYIKKKSKNNFVASTAVELRAEDNRTALSALNKENAEEKGEGFEKFIARLFNKTFFKMEEWRGDKYIDGIYAVSNMNPDMEIAYIRHNPAIKFAVECKWRKDFYKNGIEWAKEYQVHNYKNFQKEKNMKVFVVIGIGGQSSDPESVFIIPLDHIENSFISKKQLLMYKRADKSKNFYLDTNSIELK